jgi:integrase
MGRPRKYWSHSVGERGHRVTAYEQKPGGPLWLRWWIPGTPSESAHWQYRALGHTNQNAAMETAKTVAAQLLTSTLAASTGRTTVTEVFAVYERDVAKFTKGQGPREAERRMAMWTTFLGATREVATIDFPTIDRFVRERRAGTLHIVKSSTVAKEGEAPETYKLKSKPSNRAIGADIELLKAALNHATKVVRSNGTRLLTVNPITGYELPRNAVVRRPVATYDRFEKLLAKADEVDPQKLFGAFLSLVEGLGWRVSAICGLRACDVDRKAQPGIAPDGQLYKRPEIDKEGSGGWVPMSKDVRAAIDSVLAINPAIGEWPLFPAPRAKTGEDPAAMPKSWTRHHARKLLERAEKNAELDGLDGSQFHAYRRKWATERKHHSTQDVMAAGGWRDARSLQTAYQHADAATILAVVTEERKLRDSSTEGRAGRNGQAG